LQDKIVIVGSSGHAKVVIDIVEREGRYEIAGLLDHVRARGEQTLGYEVLGREGDLPRLLSDFGVNGAIVGIGDNYVRSQVVQRIAQLCPGLRFVSAVHPSSSIAKDVSIGEGTVIAPGVVLGPSCSIGRFCLINTQASLDHDCIMDDFSSVAPHGAVGGGCRIGAHSAISIGAVLKHGIRVGDHTIVGAGALVLSDLQSYRVAFGAPASEIRTRTPGEAYL